MATLFGAIALAGAFVGLDVDRSARVGRNVVVNRPGLIDANNSPSVARNPRRPDNVVVAHRVDRPNFSALLHWSLDGGATWQPSPLPLPPGRDRAFAPDVAFGPDGSLYVAYVNLEGPGNVPDNLWLSRSANGGRSLSEPLRVAGRLTFQPRLAVGRGNRVHLSWLQADDVGLLKLTGRPSPVVVATSTDGGRTFSAPVRASDPERERVGAATPVVDSAGELVVLYQDFKRDRRDFENLEGPPWEEPFALVVTRSSDGAHSFSRGIELDSDVLPTRRFLVFLPEFPSLAAGPDQQLYVTWADGRYGDEDVFLRRSEDGGRTWRSPVRVNDNRLEDGTSQYLPKVSVSPDGRVDVVFLDRRRDPRNVMTDAFLAYSEDGSGQFRNLRISSASFDSRVGPSAAPQFEVDLGSRLGLDSEDEESLAAWTDTRFGDETTGRQDVAAATVTLPEETPALGRWPVVAVAVLLGLLALGAWWALGRSTEGHAA
jgi:hypothetical protein